MAYYIRTYPPTDTISGPFKTIAEARREVTDFRFTSRARIFKGADATCALDARYYVGKATRTYSGQRWLWVYADANGRSCVINRDGTLGRRYQL